MLFRSLNNCTSYPSASQGGAAATTMRQQFKQQPITGCGNNTDIKNEGIVQKLQSVITTIRGERDQAYRSRDIAIEKLRSAKDAFQADKENLQAAKEKNVAMRNKSEQTKKDIQTLEESIRHFQQKVCVIIGIEPRQQHDPRYKNHYLFLSESIREILLPSLFSPIGLNRRLLFDITSLYNRL